MNTNNPELFYAPIKARKNAQKALKRRKEVPTSKQGLQGAGLLRAKQLAENKPFTIQDLKIMRNWFNRHYQTSRLSPKYKLRERAWIAWNGWGGTEARNWVKSVLKNYATICTPCGLKNIRKKSK